MVSKQMFLYLYDVKNGTFISMQLLQEKLVMFLSTVTLKQNINLEAALLQENLGSIVFKIRYVNISHKFIGINTRDAYLIYRLFFK